MSITIGAIPEADFYNYRLDIMFDGYKWDFQAGEQSTICDKVALIEPETLDFLSKTAVSLYHETVAMQDALKKRPDLVQKLGISPQLTNALCNCCYDADRHIRLMRFDFHPTTAGWRISEVNSDVPAGYPEASVFPQIAAKFFAGYKPCGNLGEVLTENYVKLAPPGGKIALLHDTNTVEDHQILHYLGDILKEKGFSPLYADPAYVKWENNRAVDVDAIMRYYPVEWLEHKRGVDLAGFINAETPSCNHPIALLTQSKRLPVVWDDLGVNIPFWRQYLPETVCPTVMTQDLILKPAFGRVGEGINIPGTVSDEENTDIQAAAQKWPEQWVAQKMFESLLFDGLHLGFGVFVVNGQFAGMFARASRLPRIDSEASEIPVLVREG